MSASILSTVSFHRRVYWLQAFRALSRIMKDDEFSSEAAREYGAALEGNDGERSFRAFLREPGAEELLSQRPDLSAALDDHDRLAAMPEGSLGRAYLALMKEDRIRVGELVRAADSLPTELQYRQDPLRSWYRDRRTALHDLHHVLTDYGRDAAGETALVAFSLALEPTRIWRVNLILSFFAVPKRKLGRLLPYLYGAWKRGKRARIPAATRWEEWLPLPIGEIRERLSIEPAPRCHPRGIWRGGFDGLEWAPEPAVRLSAGEAK